MDTVAPPTGAWIETINGMYRILCQKVALENNYEKYKESELSNAERENGITGVDFDHSD